MLLDKLTDFLCARFFHYDKEWMKKQIITGIREKTFDYLCVAGEPIACVRYNVINNGKVADILDLVIAKGRDGRKIIKYFVANGWMRFPSLTHIRFERGLKNKPHKIVEIQKFL